MTPDWSETPDSVPYFHARDPQRLNLYAYVTNNPSNMVDPDGHQSKKPEKPDPCNGNKDTCVTVTAAPEKGPEPEKVPLIWQLYFHTSVYKWAMRTSQRLDKHLDRWYQALDNVNWLLTPCHTPDVTCGVVFPIKTAPLLAEEEAAVQGVLKQISNGTTKGKVYYNRLLGHLCRRSPPPPSRQHGSLAD